MCDANKLDWLTWYKEKTIGSKGLHGTMGTQTCDTVCLFFRCKIVVWEAWEYNCKVTLFFIFKRCCATGPFCMKNEIISSNYPKRAEIFHDSNF